MERPPAASELRVIRSLPSQPTTMIGRAADEARIIDLLTRGDVRLVTLTGTSGDGKTRLALAATARLSCTFPSVVFVDLYAVRDSAIVASTISEDLTLVTIYLGDCDC